MEDAGTIESPVGLPPFEEGEQLASGRNLLRALVLGARAAEPHRPAAEVDVAPFQRADGADAPGRQVGEAEGVLQVGGEDRLAGLVLRVADRLEVGGLEEALADVA